MVVDVSFIISVVSVSAAVFFGYKAFSRNNNMDTTERATMDARVMTKLDSIADDLKDIQRDNKDLRKEVNHMNERILILEQNVKTYMKGSMMEV